MTISKTIRQASPGRAHLEAVYALDLTPITVTLQSTMPIEARGLEELTGRLQRQSDEILRRSEMTAENHYSDIVSRQHVSIAADSLQTAGHDGERLKGGLGGALLSFAIGLVGWGLAQNFSVSFVEALTSLSSAIAGTALLCLPRKR